MGDPNIILVCPPSDETISAGLDSSYMVPVESVKKLETEHLKEVPYVILDTIESQIFVGKEDKAWNILFDYEGHAFVKENLLEYDLTNFKKVHTYKGCVIIEKTDGIFLANAVDTDGDPIEKKCISLKIAEKWIDQVERVNNSAISDLMLEKY